MFPRFDRLTYSGLIAEEGQWRDWEMLQLWAEQGVIRLKYLDESGCYCQSPTDYSYSRRGSQKRLRQTRRRGRRLKILGVWEPQSRDELACRVFEDEYELS
ncbi:hypothetical protein [Microcoleus sp. B4-D4]|uniref:hypothetical protein n=1 Tax=Microcoleus sp. B4-D4 TaxID=2818667 RepID=UPI002FD08E20